MEQYYSVAIKKRNNASLFLEEESYSFHEIKILGNWRYWIADPFIFEDKDVTYLFYEAYDLIKCKGVIAYSILNDNFVATTPKVVIEEDYHLSFPFIFIKDNHIYIMPESCNDDSLKVYKALSFPDIWKEDYSVLEDIYCSDSVFFEFKEKRYLSIFEQFRNPPSEKKHYCWGIHSIYKLDKSGILRKLPASVTQEGDYGIRNAGAFFKCGNNLIRVGQNSTDDVYGKGMVFFRIDSVEPYCEQEIYNVDYREMQKHLIFGGEEKKIDGTHTYNVSDKYEIIDFSYQQELPMILRICRSIHLRMRRYLRRLGGNRKYDEKE